MPQCKNCQTERYGKYCHECGQCSDFDEIRLSYLVKHLMRQLFDIESRFVRTLQLLFINPAMLTKHYIAGKHRSYVNPINMYLISVTFFVLINSYFPQDINAIMDSLNKEMYTQGVKPEIQAMQRLMVSFVVENYRLFNLLSFSLLPFFLTFLFRKRKENYTAATFVVFVLYIASTLNIIGTFVNLLEFSFNVHYSLYLLPFGLIYFTIQGGILIDKRTGTILKLLFAYVFMYVCLTFVAVILGFFLAVASKGGG